MRENPRCSCPSRGRWAQVNRKHLSGQYCLILDVGLCTFYYLTILSEKLTVCDIELNALQRQDKTAREKTFQRRRKRRSRSKKKRRERMKISHITWGGKDVEEGEPPRWRFHLVSSRAAGGDREKMEERQLNLPLKLQHVSNPDVSRWRQRLDTLRGGRGAFSERLGKLINQISERFVNAPCSYQEANYHYQPPLFISGIIRLITKLSPLETRFLLFIRTKPLLSSNDTVSVMNPISICAS